MATYRYTSPEETAIEVVGEDMFIPVDESNRHYQALMDSGALIQPYAPVPPAPPALTRIEKGLDFTGSDEVGPAGMIAFDGVNHYRFGDERFGALDDTVELGSPQGRWKQLFSVTPAIATSDEQEKRDIRPFNQQELNVGKRLSDLVMIHRWIAAYEEKGENARYHSGLINQQIKAAFEAEGLDASRYGCWCADQVGSSHTRYSVRYDEVWAFILAYQGNLLHRLQHSIPVSSTWTLDGQANAAIKEGGCVLDTGTASFTASKLRLHFKSVAKTDYRHFIRSMNDGDTLLMSDIYDTENWVRYEVTGPVVVAVDYGEIPIRAIEQAGVRRNVDRDVLISFSYGGPMGGPSVDALEKRVVALEKQLKKPATKKKP